MRAQVAIWLELAKARIVGLVLVTTGAAYLTAGGAPRGSVGALLGTALLAAGTNAMNQVLEHEHDGRMRRTSHRPIPSGRIRPEAAGGFALATSIAGVAVLAFTANAVTAVIGALTFVAYNFVYTPLKRVTPACTAVGAIPGAAPALIGWAAATGAIGSGGWTLFTILFLWQLPHFIAISWTYRQDYARAGFAMLAVRDPDGHAVARDAVVYSALLLGVTAASAWLGVSGTVWVVGASAAGAVLLAAAIAFRIARSGRNARRLFMTSNAYLLGTMLLLALGGRR